jgi:hypothetical protein
MTPRHDYVLIQRINTDYKGKIVGVEIGPPRSIIKAVGPDVKAGLFPGETVIAKMNNPISLGNDLFLVKDECVVAVVEP